MSLGATADSILYLILLGLGLLASFGVVALAANLIQWLIGIRSGWFVVAFLLFVYGGGLIGLSLYLDSAGQVTQAVISDKAERIEFRDEGDWRHRYGLTVTYRAGSGSDASTHFTTSENLFDTLHTGQTVALRTVSVNGWFDLTRLADQSTWSWINWRWIGYGVGFLLLIYLGWQSLNSRAGCLTMLALLLLLATIPFGLKYQAWRASQDESRTPLRASGVIEEVHRVTTIDPLPNDTGGGDGWETEIEVAQLYDIVVVRYTPQGWSEAIRGVDAVDAEEGSLEKGMTVEFAYAPAKPRQIRLPNRTRNHHILNPLEWLKQQAVAVGLVVLILLDVSLLERRWRRWFGAARRT